MCVCVCVCVCVCKTNGKDTKQEFLSTQVMLTVLRGFCCLGYCRNLMLRDATIQYDKCCHNYVHRNSFVYSCFTTESRRKSGETKK